MVIPFQEKEKKKCSWITIVVFIQCAIVFVGSFTILNCLWTPDIAVIDFDKLARIMYLYDPQACGYKLKVAKSIANLQFSNDTRGFDVLPIPWKAAIVTVSTRLSEKTRRYIELSLVVHVVWMLSAIALRICLRTAESKLRITKITLTIFFYMFIFTILFDLSMAIVYIAHIQQSLSKGMILRYSGWSVEMQVENPDDFAGWLPITASVCWIRGGVILGLNIYMSKIIYYIRRKIKRKELGKKIQAAEFLPIPEARTDLMTDNSKVLYYRTGEQKPYFKKNIIDAIYY